MRIAVVGGGVSGLVAAWLLSRRHEVTLFEKEPRLGGHAHTHVLEHAGRTQVLDTGFLVFNERTYPLLQRLFAELGVESQPSEMSFGVRCRRCGLEYASRSTGAFLAQRWRALDPRHLMLFQEIRRFHREAASFLERWDESGDTVGEFVGRHGFGTGFVRHFLLPMTGAIWSASFSEMRSFPARTLFQFLSNHGLLAITGAPTWYTVKGGSHTYVRAIARALEGRVSAGTAVEQIARDEAGVTVTTAQGRTRVDAVVVATHADEGLAMLTDPSPEERAALGAFRYSRNRTLLHTDRAVLPARRAAWASWNLDLVDCRDERSPVSVTYDLNRLQRLPEAPAFLVSLNRQVPVAGPVLAAMDYTHPILDAAAIAAQPRVRALNGTRRTYFCGAHLRYGFHEDGVMSAVDVAARLGVDW